MNIEPQTSAERSLLAEMIADIAVVMMTTTALDGTLVSRPMAPVEMAEDGAIWFFTDSRTAKINQLEVMNLAFTDPADGKYVSISANGEVHNDKARIKRLWSPAIRPWFPDGPESPNLCLLKVIPSFAEYWDASGSKMVRLLAHAASIVTGKQIGMGEHDVISNL